MIWQVRPNIDMKSSRMPAGAKRQAFQHLAFRWDILPVKPRSGSGRFARSLPRTLSRSMCRTNQPAGSESSESNVHSKGVLHAKFVCEHAEVSNDRLFMPVPDFRVRL